MSAVVSTEEEFEIVPTIDISKAFKALGNEGQLDVVVLLKAGPMLVNDLVAALNKPQPTVSKYLKVLKEAQLVESETFGVNREYSLVQSSFEDIDALLGALSGSRPSRVVIDEDGEVLIDESDESFESFELDSKYTPSAGIQMIPFKNWDAEIEETVASVRRPSDSEPEPAPAKRGFLKRLFS